MTHLKWAAIGAAVFTVISLSALISGSPIEENVTLQSPVTAAIAGAFWGYVVSCVRQKLGPR